MGLNFHGCRAMIEVKKEVPVMLKMIPTNPIVLDNAVAESWTKFLAFYAQELHLVQCVIVLLIYKLIRRHLSMYGPVEELLQSQNNLMSIEKSTNWVKEVMAWSIEKSFEVAAL
ncbi:hypothetical protein L3X38_010472 [Prunus dulcis]|uniref:Uncharacterized protein n=1 Tax=Prunus dulcis TaxID=3755 RepID=A0AAD4WHU2_PRUDU|nr:hypothetical protein L3X38_010472 [Prunus dulcis]